MLCARAREPYGPRRTRQRLRSIAASAPGAPLDRRQPAQQGLLRTRTPRAVPASAGSAAGASPVGAAGRGGGGRLELRRRSCPGRDLLGPRSAEGRQSVASAVHRRLGLGGTFPQATQGRVQRPQYRGVFRRADPAARIDVRPDSAARRAPAAAIAAHGAARAASLDHRSRLVASQDHGGAHPEDAGRAPGRAPRNAGARRTGPRRAGAGEAPAAPRRAAEGS